MIPSIFLNKETTVFWFRRDLRLKDNRGLYEALKSNPAVVPIFIFDTTILNDLTPDDKRVKVIHQLLEDLQSALISLGSSLYVYLGAPSEFFKRADFKNLYFNRDYEPYAEARDSKICSILSEKGIPSYSFKDHVIFEKSEILSLSGNPYTIFTPYSRKWKEMVSNEDLKEYTGNFSNLYKLTSHSLPTLSEIGFREIPTIHFPREIDPVIGAAYHLTRDQPSKETTRLGVALRFGAISTRALVRSIKGFPVLLGEIIWRDFFQMVMHHFPQSATRNFKKQYDAIPFLFDESILDKWKNGTTGYPLVDAGMRELNATGFMHNRVRMITASFLTKHLLHHWTWGETYFAEKLLDFELASNVGNWQWAAGTGCDASPYFRVFNPQTQMLKFDPELIYINKWLPEYGTADYPSPMVEHSSARIRAIETYKRALSNQN